MRKVELKGWVIFDENELQHGKNMVAQIDHELFNVEGVMQWSLVEVSNEETEFNWDDEDEE